VSEMGSALVAIILVALLITSGMTFSRVAIDSVDNISENWKQSISLNQDKIRTDIDVIDAEVSSSLVDVYVQNAGKIQISNFSSWDVFVHYYDINETYYLSRLDYVEDVSPGENQWTVNTIYNNEDLSHEELFQPGILDPGEVVKLQLNLYPFTDIISRGWIILSTGNGVTASTQFEVEENQDE
jgi:archaellum component FlaF (FlaF/FlaG flagellin family)